jgi:uncharacterized protein
VPTVSSELPLQLKVHRAFSEIPRAAWDALLDEDCLPFLEWEWLDALESSGSICPATGWIPRHLTLWQGTRLVAAAPAYVKTDSHGEFVFDWAWAEAAARAGLSYYPKLLIAAPITPATGRRILVAKGEDRPARERAIIGGALELARSEGLSSVHVLFPTEGETQRLEELGFASRLGVQYHWRNEGYDSFDDYLARFTSKRRAQIRRERRGVTDQGVQVETLRGEALRTVDPAEVHRLYASTLDKHPWGIKYLTPAFFERLLKGFSHRVELVQARRDGKVIAGAFNLASPKVLYGRYWGCFEEVPFLHFEVCLYHSVDAAIRRGLTRFEPGAGGEHKLVRGFQPTLTYSAHRIFHPGLDAAVRKYLQQESAALREGLPSWQAETGLKPKAT